MSYYNRLQEVYTPICILKCCAAALIPFVPGGFTSAQVRRALQLTEAPCWQERMIVEYDNARVLITDQKLETIKEVLPLLEQLTRINQPLLIIAEDVTGACRGFACPLRCKQVVIAKAWPGMA